MGKKGWDAFSVGNNLIMKKIILMFGLFFGIKSFSQTTQNQRLNHFIDEWLGLPYKLGGSTKSGIDCSNFVIRLYKDVFDMNITGTCYKLWNNTNRIVLDSLHIGDLVFFNTMRQSFSHVGIYVGDNKFIHSPRPGKQVKVEDMRQSYWLSRFTGARRVDSSSGAETSKN